MLRCLFCFTQCHLMIWGSNPSKSNFISQVRWESFDRASGLYAGGLPTKCRHPGMEHTFLQAFQGSLEAGHWLYQAKCSKGTRMKVEQGTAEGKEELQQETRHPFGLRKSVGISMDRKKHSSLLPHERKCTACLSSNALTHDRRSWSARGRGQYLVPGLVCDPNCSWTHEHLRHY